MLLRVDQTTIACGALAVVCVTGLFRYIPTPDTVKEDAPHQLNLDDRVMNVRKCEDVAVAGMSGRAATNNHWIITSVVPKANWKQGMWSDKEIRNACAAAVDDYNSNWKKDGKRPKSFNVNLSSSSLTAHS